MYESLPLPIKRLVYLIPFGWIAGPAYRRTMARQGFFDRLSREEIRAYQEKRLGEILAYATAQVPAYRSLQQVVERHSPFEAIKFFPFTSKRDLQENRQQYLSRDFERIPHYELTTGGTSGNQLHFFVDNDSQIVDTAFQHRLWRRVGYHPGIPKATFRGVSFSHLKPGCYWQENPIYNELQFSPFHMNNQTLPAYVEQLIRYRPQYLHGYPSAIELLAEFIIREGRQEDLPRIKAAFLISEGFAGQQRERIEAAFQTRVFSFYGHSERIIMAGECEANETYHQFPDYGFIEIVDENGNACDEPGSRGELVGTGFLCRSMPLIRYQTGDLATRCEAPCACGRCWDRFTNVEGRWKQDIIYGKNGSRLSTTALNMHSSIFDKVMRYQYFQEKVGECELRIEVAPEFTEKDRQAIAQAYAKKIGQELTMEIAVVDQIPLTPRGKLKLLVSKIAENKIPES